VIDANSGSLVERISYTRATPNLFGMKLLNTKLKAYERILD
jgi:hypothetical protein